jgi:uncharacterized membrane protein
MNALFLARALHVLAVVIWIGGVSMVTAVLLPAVRSSALGSDRLRAFEAIERRFVWIARATVLVAGVTGFYMVARLELWGRFGAAQFWWMHAMVGVWMLFALILFVIEPLGLNRRVLARGATTPDMLFARMHRAHVVLLALALITIAGAVAGSHGWLL